MNHELPGAPTTTLPSCSACGFIWYRNAHVLLAVAAAMHPAIIAVKGTPHTQIIQRGDDSGPYLLFLFAPSILLRKNRTHTQVHPRLNSGPTRAGQHKSPQTCLEPLPQSRKPEINTSSTSLEPSPRVITGGARTITSRAVTFPVRYHTIRVRGLETTASDSHVCMCRKLVTPGESGDLDTVSGTSLG